MLRQKDVALGKWDLGRLKRARIVARAYAGRCFDIYRLEAGDRALALKVPAEAPSGREPSFVAVRELGGVSTEWDVIGVAGRPVMRGGRDPWVSDVVGPASADELLEDESRRLESAGPHWNHRLVRLARGDLGGRLAILGLVTPWQPGVPLASLERAEQRSVLLRILPALWDALAAALHGDLHGSNVMIAPDGAGFALIDPGAQVLRHRGRSGPSSGADGLTFVTTAESYPVLPPYYCPDLPLAAVANLRGHWGSFIRSMTRSDQFPPLRVGEHVVGHSVHAGGGRFLARPPASAGEPHPADLLAVGVLYYEALTGAYPFEGLAVPAWAAVTSEDERVDGCTDTATWLVKGVVRPSDLDPTVRPEEEALALALLDLQVPSRERLVELVGACAGPMAAQ